MKKIFLSLLLILACSSALASYCVDGASTVYDIMVNSALMGCRSAPSGTTVTANPPPPLACQRITMTSGSGQFFMPMNTLAEWNAFLSHPPGNITLATCSCGAGTVSWNISGITCNGSILSGNPGDNLSANDGTAPTTGSGTFQCQSGTWVNTGGTCVSSCAATTLNWTVGADTCSANTVVTGNGATANLTDSTAPTTGGATYTCNNGSWSAPSGATCSSVSCPSGTSVAGAGGVASPASCHCNTGGDTWCATTLSCETPATSCAGTTFNWGSCSAAVGATASGSSPTLTNTNAGFSGSATYTCSNTVWSGPTGNTCNSTGCGATTLGWNSSCSAPVGATANGGGVTLTNTVGGFSGTASFTCNSGTWSAPSSNSCNAAPAGCSAQTLSWPTGCSGPISSVASGSFASASNTASSHSGNATYDCSNGTWTIRAGATCTTVGAPCNHIGHPNLWNDPGTPNYECKEGGSLHYVDMVDGQSDDIFANSCRDYNQGALQFANCTGSINLTCNNGSIVYTNNGCAPGAPF